MSGPADITKASGLMTGMYGGPLWAALARSGIPGANPDIANLINQNFDPWFNQRTPAGPARPILPNATPINDAYVNQETGQAWSNAEWDAMKAAQTGWDQSQVKTTPPNYWEGLTSQRAQQQATQDPMLQQLQQYIQGMQGLTQNADPIMQAIQQNLQGAPVGGVLPQAQPGAPGFTSSAPGTGGVDLMALLRQLGYAT